MNPLQTKETCAINCTEKTPQINEGIIDNISIVFSGLNSEIESGIKNTYVGWLMAGDLKPTHTSRNGYKKNSKFREDKYGGRVLFSVLPVKPNAAPFRVEFNPAKLGKKLVEELVLDITAEMLIGGVGTFYKHARVTRVDVAFDLFGLELNELFLWSDGNIVNQTFQKEGMRTETVIQSYSKIKQLVIYNKAKEMADKGLIPISDPWTRVEARARSCGYLTSLANLNNPLLGFHICHRERPEHVGHNFWILLNAAVDLTTAQSVVQKLTPSGRVKIKKIFNSSPLDIWDAEKLWQNWPDILKASGLLSAKVLL
jgi:hypothetical protein